MNVPLLTSAATYGRDTLSFAAACCVVNICPATSAAAISASEIGRTLRRTLVPSSGSGEVVDDERPASPGWSLHCGLLAFGGCLVVGLGTWHGRRAWHRHRQLANIGTARSRLQCSRAGKGEVSDVEEEFRQHRPAPTQKVTHRISSAADGSPC